MPWNNYHFFRLRVTDDEGAVGVAYANVTIQAEPDYPPTADAGESILIHRPHDEVTLDGGRSKDDKGIVKYSWKLTKGSQVEMKVIIIKLYDKYYYILGYKEQDCAC